MTGDRLLLRVVRYGGGWVVLLAAATLAGTAAALLLPAALGRTVDAVLAGAGAGDWLAACAVLVAVAAAADVVGDLAAGATGARATEALRHRLIRHVLCLHPRAVPGFPAGDLVTRVVGQVPEAGQAGIAAVQVITAGLPSLGSLVALTVIDPWLGLTFVAGLVLLAVLLRAFVTDASTVAAHYQGVQGRIGSRLIEALGGARTIAAAGTVEHEIARVLAPLPVLRGHGLRTWQILARAAAQTSGTAPLLQVAVVAVGGLSLAAGRLTPGELFAALQYAAFGGGLGGVLAALNQLTRARAGSRRIAEVLAAPVREYGASHLAPGPGRLQFRGVTVHGARGAALRGVDLDIPGGTAVAVVGRSGAGKSTLAAVAGRLIDPDEGHVRLDGVPLATLRRDELRAAIGYAFERPVLIGDTIAEALTLGHRAREARAVAGAAAIGSFVDHLPERYLTPLADAPMSGGEAQRLGLARALHADRLLILDDATSSLDTATEHQVSAALFGNDRRTRIVVAHRASTAARADQVVWLDQGSVRAIGPHQRLWDDPAYRALFQEQS